MALKAVIEKLEDVDEQHRGLYVEKDGKFHLDVEGGTPPLEPNKSVLADLAKERKKRQDLEAQIKSWTGLGKTNEEIAALIEEHEKRGVDDATNKGQWDKLAAQMNERHAKELEKVRKEISTRDEALGKLRTTLERNMRMASATAAIARAKGVPELLLPYVDRHLKVNEKEEGSFDFALTVVDEKGEPRVNGKGEPLTLDELVSEMQANDIFGRAFEGSGSRGSGATAGGRTPGSNIAKKSDFKTEKERADYVDKFGMAQYNSLPF